MIEYLLFALYLGLMFIMMKLRRNRGLFTGIASFSTGMLQALLLFLIFFLIFRGTATDVMMIDNLRLMRILTIDMFSVVLFILFVFINSRSIKASDEMKTIAINIIQLFLPVLLLNTSLILLIRFDTPFNQQFYMSIIVRYFSLLFFKVMFVISGLLVLYYSRNQGSDKESGNTL